MVLAGAGLGFVACAANCAAVNSSSAGPTVEPLPPSSTHKLPLASNCTPYGAPKPDALLSAICGAGSLTPAMSWLGRNSNTFAPFATHSAVLVAGVVVGRMIGVVPPPPPQPASTATNVRLSAALTFLFMIFLCFVGEYEIISRRRANALGAWKRAKATTSRRRR